MCTPATYVDGAPQSEQSWFQDFYVERGKVPLRREGMPEDVSGAVVFLASDYCRYMTGQLLVVDGGVTSTF